MTVKVKERPIIFGADSVRAILEGRKTQTRRSLKNADDFLETDESGKFVFMHAPTCPSYCDYACAAEGEVLESHVGWTPWGSHPERRCRLWVREAFRAVDDPGARKSDNIRRMVRDEFGARIPLVVDYRADGGTRIMDKIGRPEWKSPIHMPRWASRLTLEITSVRVERLQAISEDDAKAEGLLEWSDPPRIPTKHYGKGVPDVWEQDPRQAFARIWDSINGKKHPWSSNPWVWVIEFSPLKESPP